MYRNIAFILAAMLMLSGSSCDKDSQKTSEGGKTSSDVAAPSSVSVDSAADGCLAFSWDAVAGARIYVGKLCDASGAVVPLGQKNITVKEGEKRPSVSYDGLSAGRYSFSVKVTTSAGTSPYSSPLEVELATGSGSQGEEGGNTGEGETVIGDRNAIYAALMIPEYDKTGPVKAFPGAEGGGSLTTGGRGGEVYHVTSLEDDASKQGTLRWAVNQKGARTIVFDVAGIIPLGGDLVIKNGDLTIAGQTAPGGGICLKNYTLRINCSNVIIRFIRCRMGDEKMNENDAMNLYTNSNPGFQNVIVDHCSLSWCMDECGSFYGMSDFTLQHCILSESLRMSGHEKGAHGYGGLWGGSNASYHHNLLIHHDSRNPRFSHDYLNTEKGPIHYYNNVVYNWGSNSSYGGEGGPNQQQRQINMVANYYKPGPASSNRTRFVNPTTKCSNCNSADKTAVTPGLFYLEANYMYGSEEVTADNWKGVHPDDASLLPSVKSESYMGTRPSRIQTAQEAFETVLDIAGASLSRDRIDIRLADEARRGITTYTGSVGNTKGLIDKQSDVGGWPVYEATAKQLSDVLDTDGDGIPDWCEVRFGLDRLDKSDGAKTTLDLSGRYTNLEMYLHYIVREIVARQ